MKIKVDHDVLELTSYEILGNAKEFEDVLKVWNDNILQLPNIWQGEDANEFYLNMGMYLEQLKESDPLFYYFNMGKLHTSFGNVDDAIEYLTKQFL